jgi:hypothetical protein
MATQILPVRFRAAKAPSPPDRRRLRDDGLEDVVRPDAADVLVEVNIGAGNLIGTVCVVDSAWPRFGLRP